MIKVTVWNEFRHEKESEEVKKLYGDGIHNVIATFLKESGSDFDVKTATLDEPEHGLTCDVLDNTDVLIWWGHRAHGEVSDEIVDRVQKRVLDGMGLIVLHSGHHSKIFKRLMGTSCNLRWRVAEDNSTVWTVSPGHPIAQGIGDSIFLEKEEMYGEFFDIPNPDEVIFISSFTKGENGKGGGTAHIVAVGDAESPNAGEVFRSGVTYTRGKGRIFYFQPGHETYPSFYNEQVRKVIVNAVNWAAK